MAPDTYEKYFHYCRIIASFAKTGLNPRTNVPMLKAWLASVNATEEQIKDIVWIVTNGRFEYEENAKKFVNNMNIHVK